ncbi:hypothetical protein ACSJL3_005208 (plasmid) [Serratia nevei]|uniref:hypothetical protein n=1 Tax=Serratia nevei TaxID=2703794 RepID=UPI003F6C845F
MNIYKTTNLMLLIVLAVTKANAASPSFKVSVTDYNVYKNAYSHVTLDVSTAMDGAPPAYIEIPSFISNEPQVQKLFEVNTKKTGKNAPYLFDIYFPLPEKVTSLYLKIYPLGTDPKKLSDTTPAYIYDLDLSKKKDGSALMLYQENKEKNVRIYSSTEINSRKPYSNYIWYGTILPKATAKINKAIIHLTEEQGSNVIETSSFSIDNRVLHVQNDPANGNKKHLYFFTGQDGKATLTVRPDPVTKSGRLVYWPFADTSSEAMRIVVYDDQIFGTGLQSPIPTQNPITLKIGKNGKSFNFKIPNATKTIHKGGYIYILVNGKYMRTIPSTSDDVIDFEITRNGINTSKTEYPESNTIQYIYIDEYGNVKISRKRAFFAFSEG